jgi:hypothetical protein
MISNHVFKNFIKYGKNVAISLTFFASGLYHCYPIFILVDQNKDSWILLTVMVSFFILQIPIIFLEKKFKIQSSLLTYVIIFTFVPLFIQPAFIFFDNDHYIHSHLYKN